MTRSMITLFMHLWVTSVRAENDTSPSIDYNMSNSTVGNNCSGNDDDNNDDSLFPWWLNLIFCLISFTCSYYFHKYLNQLNNYVFARLPFRSFITRSNESNNGPPQDKADTAIPNSSVAIQMEPLLSTAEHHEKNNPSSASEIEDNETNNESPADATGMNSGSDDYDPDDES